LFYNQIFAVNFMSSQLAELYKFKPTSSSKNGDNEVQFDSYLRDLYIKMKFSSERSITHSGEFISHFYTDQHEDIFNFREMLLDRITFQPFTYPSESINLECDKCGFKIFVNKVEHGCVLLDMSAEADSVNFYESLRNYNRQDAGEDFCHKCKKITNHTESVTLDLNKAQYLEINLTRLWNENETVVAQKAAYVESFVDSTTNITYNLISTICKVGKSTKYGHYVALIKNWDTNNWYKYDDKTITNCDPFCDCYRSQAIYLCYASTIASNEAMQLYENTFKMFSEKFPSEFDICRINEVTNKWCNINRVKSLFANGRELYVLPKKWLQGPRTNFPLHFWCSSCSPKQVPDDRVLVPFSILKLLFGAINKTQNSNKKFTNLKCNNCSRYAHTLFS
jgi:hypothetical protein